MKVCPTCQNQYPEDCSFCLRDGSTLVKAINEVEYLGAVTQTLHFCGNCSQPVSPDFAFCKKCGTPQNHYARHVDPPPIPATATVDVSVSAGAVPQPWIEQNKTVLIIGTIIAATIVIALMIYFVSQGDNQTGTANTVSNRSNGNANLAAKPAANAPTNNANRAAVNQSSSSTSPSLTGEFGTDLNIRAEPNKLAASLGIHFRGAKFRVIESTSFQTPEGEMSTWYRVTITEYGCSMDANLGCGKNSPGDSDTGWINAKYVTLD